MPVLGEFANRILDNIMRYALFHDGSEKQPSIIYDLHSRNSIIGESSIQSININTREIFTDNGVLQFEFKRNKKFEAKITNEPNTDLPLNVTFCDFKSWETRDMLALPRFHLRGDLKKLYEAKKDFFLEISGEEIIDLSENVTSEFFSQNSAVRDRVLSNYLQLTDPNGFAVLFNTYNFFPSMTRLHDGSFLRDTIHFANWKCIHSDGTCHSRLNGNFYFNDHKNLQYKHYDHVGLLVSPVSYTHFLVQTVPMLYNAAQLLRKGIIDRRKFAIISPLNMLSNEAGQYFLNMFGLHNIPIIDPGNDNIDAFGIDCLLVSSHEGNFPPFLYENTILEVFSQICPDYIKAKDRPVAMIASRKDVGNRRGIANEDELANKLELAGFEVVVVRGSELSFSQQRELYGHASIVIGPHGANIANAMFSPKNAPVIEIVNDDVGVNVFWYMNLFNRLGRRYHLMNFTSNGDGWTSSFDIDVEAVVQAAVRLLKEVE